MKTTEQPQTDKDGYLLLPKNFTDKNWNFEQIKTLSGGWFIYRKTHPDLKLVLFELIKSKKQEEYTFHGNLIPKKWTYPSDSTFGHNGFECISLERCLEKHKELKDKKEEKESPTAIVWPKGEFLVKDVEKLNKNLTAAKIYSIIKENLTNKVLKVVGEKENNKGKPSKIYKLT